MARRISWLHRRSGGRVAAGPRRLDHARAALEYDRQAWNPADRTELTNALEGVRRGRLLFATPLMVVAMVLVQRLYVEAVLESA